MGPGGKGWTQLVCKGVGRTILTDENILCFVSGSSDLGVDPAETLWNLCACKQGIPLDVWYSSIKLTFKMQDEHQTPTALRWETCLTAFPGLPGQSLSVSVSRCRHVCACGEAREPCQHQKQSSRAKGRGRIRFQAEQLPRDLKYICSPSRESKCYLSLVPEDV